MDYKLAKKYLKNNKVIIWLAFAIIFAIAAIGGLFLAVVSLA